MIANGAKVRRGKLLGYSGNTGVSGGFAHLHYDEVSNSTGARVDPGPFILCRAGIRRRFPPSGDWSDVPAFERRIGNDGYNC